MSEKKPNISISTLSKLFRKARVSDKEKKDATLDKEKSSSPSTIRFFFVGDEEFPSIRRKDFGRVVRDVFHQLHPDADYKIQASALKGLHVESEDFIVRLFCQAQSLAAESETLSVPHMKRALQTPLLKPFDTNWRDECVFNLNRSQPRLLAIA